MVNQLIENDAIENFLWDTKFPDECQQLPLDYLDNNTQILIKKCIAKEDLTDEEKNNIREVLASYRPYFEEYNTTKIEENIEAGSKIIKTENELLRLLHDKNRYRIDMNYWINGEKYILQLRIKPFTDKQYIDTIGTQMGLFRDLNKEEKKLVAKAESNQPMTKEEANMYKSLMDKINDKIYDMEYNVKVVNEFLADRVEFINSELTSFESKLEFWKELDLNTKTALFHEVRGRLRLNDTFEEELFPAVR